MLLRYQRPRRHGPWRFRFKVGWLGILFFMASVALIVRAAGADTSADNPNPSLPGADVAVIVLVLERALYYLAAFLRSRVPPDSVWARLIVFILDGLKKAGPGLGRTSLVLAIMLPALALAQPAKSPPFGGCNAAGTVCAGPTTSVSLLGIDLKTGDIMTGIIPGVGYQVSFMANKWHTLGFGGYVNVQTGSGGAPPSALLSGIFSFAEYLRLGAGWQAIGGTHRWLGLLGLGLNF